MQQFTSHAEAVAAMITFDREKFSAMPEHVQAEMDRLAGGSSGLGISVVERTVNTAELLYANRASLTRNVDRVLVAQLIDYAVENDWHGLRTSGRGDRIKNVMLGEAGDEAARAVAEEDVPPPLRQFVDSASIAPTLIPISTP